MHAPIERYLKIIEKADPILKDDGEDSITITLCGGSIVSGNIHRTTQGCYVYLEEMRVLPESAQGHGIGRRLLRTFFRHCAEIGAEYVNSDVVSVAAMQNRNKVFGETALHFIEETQNGEVELPLSTEQACASLDRADKIFDTLTTEEQAKLSPGIMVRVYLADVDTSRWEAPVPAAW